MSVRALARLLLLGVVAVWGVTFALVKDALTDVSPLLFNLLRMTLAFGVLLAVNWRGLRQLSGRSVASGMFVGVFLAGGVSVPDGGAGADDGGKDGLPDGVCRGLCRATDICAAFTASGRGEAGLAHACGCWACFQRPGAADDAGGDGVARPLREHRVRRLAGACLRGGVCGASAGAGSCVTASAGGRAGGVADWGGGGGGCW